jgi:hypothetical protein
MSKDCTSKVSQTDWKALETIQDKDIDVSDLPEIAAEKTAQATLPR